MSGKGKGKGTLGFAPTIPEVDPPSPHSMEALRADSLMFEEPLIQDLNKEVVFNLALEFKALVIKKVLDLLSESTPFQMAAVITLYVWFGLLFPDFLSFF